MLADIADVFTPEVGPCGAVELCHVPGEDVDAPRVRQLQAGEQVQERRLPRPGRPGHGGEARRPELGVEPVEHLPRRVALRHRAGGSNRSL